MRITINQYILNGYRLKIESHSDTGIDTSVDIDMTKLSFFKGKIPSRLIELFYLSSVVYGIDRSISRHACSIDGWSREFHVFMRLPNSVLFMQNKEKVDKMLSFLTGDIWDINYEYTELPEMPAVNIPEMGDDY